MQKFLAALAVTSALVSAPAATAETLADALISAYKTSHLLDQNQAVLRAADEDAAIAVAKLRPTVDFIASGGYGVGQQQSSSTGAVYNFEGTSGTAELTAQVAIYAGGRGRLGVELAKEAINATKAGLIGVEQQVLLGTVAAYSDVRLQSEIVALRQSNMRLITQELRAAKDRFDVGEVTLTDVSMAEAALAAARSGLAAAQGNLEVAREKYKSATGHYPTNLKSLPASPKLPANEEAARAIAVRNHPSVIAAQHQAKIADLRVQITKGSFKPTVAGSLTLSENLNNGLDQAQLGLRLSQPIYHGGELSALYRQSLAQKEAAEAGMHQAVVGVSENLGSAWANLTVANASIKAGSLQVAAAQKAFDGVREEAKLGARTTLDVLNAEQDLLNARANKLQSEASRYLGVYQVLAATGQLTASRLNLGIASFDTEAYYNDVKNAPATSTQGKKLDRIMKKIKR